MRLIMGAINGHYLREITQRAVGNTEKVSAAVAYAADTSLLFNWCLDHNIPLKFYGRLDPDVAVKVPILQTFISRRSAKFACSLVHRHHAKVIWWHGYGAYIGSANLTDAAWHKNIEAGCFFSEDEITDEMRNDLRSLFTTLDKHATPLTEEVVRKMEERARDLMYIHDKHAKSDVESFWETPSFTTWGGLGHVAPPSSREEQAKQIFLEEWHATLQHLRDIGEEAAKNRPSWVDSSAPAGAQADQFLNAHYYQCTFEGQKSNYEILFEENKDRRDEALVEAMSWWRQLPEAPKGEGVMLNETAPFLRAELEEERLAGMTEERFSRICSGVHAIIERARQVPNDRVGLPSAGRSYPMEEKIAALSKHIWNSQTPGGARVNEVLRYILYEGEEGDLPLRLWEAAGGDPKWKISELGINSLGEIVGWALPDRFPPRNGRTSKALRSLGFDVEVY